MPYGTPPPWSCLTTRSREVSNPRDCVLNRSYRSVIWQASRQRCCRDACQISERSHNSKPISRGFEFSRDLVSYPLVTRLPAGSRSRSSMDFRLSWLSECQMEEHVFCVLRRLHNPVLAISRICQAEFPTTHSAKINGKNTYSAVLTNQRCGLAINKIHDQAGLFCFKLRFPSVRMLVFNCKF